MEAQKFTEKIYGPYGEAWKVIKILWEAEDNNPKLQEVLDDYCKAVTKFEEKYRDNDFAKLLYRVMLDSDTVIMRMNRNEIPKTKADK